MLSPEAWICGSRLATCGWCCVSFRRLGGGIGNLSACRLKLRWLLGDLF